MNNHFLLMMYSLGAVLWQYVWSRAGGNILFQKHKMLCIPYTLVFFALFAQPIIAYLNDIQIGSVANEIGLITFVERNTLQLIQSNVGILIVSPIITSLTQRPIPKRFIIFQSLSIVFIVGGVLPIYWTPSSDGTFLYYLRHFKTIPYSIGIGCLLCGVIILLDYLLEQPAASKTEEGEKKHPPEDI